MTSRAHHVTMASVLAAAGPTGLDVVTLVIAVLGLLLGAVGLVWQIQSWRYEGARVKVSLGTAFPVYGVQLGDPHYQVTATNVGRSQARYSDFDSASGTRPVRLSISSERSYQR